MKKIKKIKDGLFVGEAVNKNGNTVYLGIEKLDPKNYAFWQSYRYLSLSVGMKFLQKLVKYAECNNFPKYPQEEAAMFANKAEYQKVVQFVTKNFKRFETLASYGIGGGIAGLNYALEEMKLNKNREEDDKKDVYIAYASAKPITDFLGNKGFYSFFNISTYSTYDEIVSLMKSAHAGHTTYTFIKQLEDFIHNYYDIIMSVALITNKNSPSTTHFGIFRNAVDFLDPLKQYRGISMLLHGFVARYGRKFLGKQCQVNSPIKKMTEILIKKLGNENVTKITKKTQITALNHITDSFALMGPNNHTVKIELKKLAKFYRDAEIKQRNEQDKNVSKPSRLFDHLCNTNYAIKKVLDLEFEDDKGYLVEYRNVHGHKEASISVNHDIPGSRVIISAQYSNLDESPTMEQMIATRNLLSIIKALKKVMPNAVIRINSCAKSTIKYAKAVVDGCRDKGYEVIFASTELEQRICPRSAEKSVFNSFATHKGSRKSKSTINPIPNNVMWD